MRAPVLAAAAATIHFVVSFALAVLAFIAQGDLTDAGPPLLFISGVSTIVNVLEFPLVAGVRAADPERLRGFTAAANSVLWGVGFVFACYLVGRVRLARDTVRRDV